MSEIVSIEGVKWPTDPRPSTNFGEPPQLRWLSLAQLRIDRAYQRDILKSGRSNIRRIVESFRWSRFGQIVCATRAGDIFAIVDGQHRAIAAFLLGIEKVPCIVISCDIAEEAEAFAAINGNVTRPSTLQIFNARQTAGDRKARALRKVLDAAGVTVPRYAVLCTKEGMCTAISTLEFCHAKFGEEILAQALTLVVGGGKHNIGLLKPSIIGALCELLATPRRPSLHNIRQVLDHGGLSKLHEKSVRIQGMDGGSVRAHLVGVILKAVEKAAA